MSSHSLRVDLLRDEYWWGGAVQDGALAPYHRGKPYQMDLREKHAGNQAQPLLLSSKGRYVWSEGAFQFAIIEGELQVNGSKPIVLSSNHHHLRGAYIAAVNTYFPPSGRTPDKINFLAPQYNTWIEMTYEPTQIKVLDYVAQLQENGMPTGIFMIDDNWMEDYGCWRFHSGRFPDPRTMIEHLRDAGFKLILWVCPYVSPDHFNFRYLRDKQLLVRDSKGDVAIRQWWNGHSALLDLTHPEARGWIRAQLDELVQKYGVHGFKFDAGDPEVYRHDDKLFDPSSPSDQCAQWASIGLHYPSSEYRACWKNANQPLIQRLSDKQPIWGRGGLADLIPNGLTQNLMGFQFNCPDMIGGGEWSLFRDPHYRVDQEHFVRMTQCAALFPIMQFSIAPWRVLDEHHLHCCMQMVNLRQKMGPEILTLAQKAATDGEPIMRSLAYAYPENCYEKIMDQFLLGDDILVAPVVTRGATRRLVIFPPGAWRGDDGTIVHGPAEIEVSAPLNRLPWYRLTRER